jgi:hypothetical protein
MEPQGALKDFEFGRSTMEVRWQQGLSDALTTLKASPWLAPMPKELGVRVFDVMHEILVGHRKQGLSNAVDDIPHRGRRGEAASYAGFVR